MELWAEAQTNVFSSDVDADISLPLKIISNTTTIPIIVTDENDSIVNKTNIENIDEKDSAKLRNLLEKLKKENLLNKKSPLISQKLQLEMSGMMFTQ